jgi:hypothetical protein
MASVSVMRYRIENISVPHLGGIAHPGTPHDDSRELKGRRIVHVLKAVDSGASEMSLQVLTEEED